MELSKLKQAVSNHSGVFHCVPRGNEDGTKLVNFKHHYETPESVTDIPDIGMMKEFYSAFGNLSLYHHEESGDAAFFIATPKHWEELREYFWGWIENLDDDEREEIVPNWVEDCISIGEIPSSGNYLLVPTSGEKAGYVFEFEHDGFEFIEHGSNLCDFVSKMLSPSSSTLTGMASHMTFFEENSDIQWWIDEMRDNKGNVIRTEA